MLLQALAVASSVSAAPPVRTSVTFDYGWSFALGDPAGVEPPLSTASTDASFAPNSTDGLACGQLAWSQLGRMGPDDCRGACSATPGCLAWQYRSTDNKIPQCSGPRGCFIHDGTLGGPPVCTAPAADPGNYSCLVGEHRPAVPPPIQQRAGVAWKESGFDDSGWAAVDLPHDFVLLADYSEAADSHHGYIPRDRAGWYRKSFALPASWAAAEGGGGGGGGGGGDGGATWLHFEGVFQAVDVFVNGQFALRHTSGYLGFQLRLDVAALGLRHGAASRAAPNVIALRVDASFGSGHWYEGGGVQRRVWLRHAQGGGSSAPAAALRLVDDGTFVATERSLVDVEGGGATALAPTTEVAHDGVAAAGSSVTVTYELFEGAAAGGGGGGAAVAKGASSVTALSASGTTLVTGARLALPAPRLWSVQAPALYTLVTTLTVSPASSGSSAAGAVAVADTMNTTVGVRAIAWPGASGAFELNGAPLHIRGFSHHSDFGAVGGAVPDRLNLFRANALRSVGGNTWRTSHNPYAPAVYDILDAVGVLVWDENRDFNRLNTGDMETLVRRDRNHPS